MSDNSKDNLLYGKFINKNSNNHQIKHLRGTNMRKTLNFQSICVITLKTPETKLRKIIRLKQIQKHTTHACLIVITLISNYPFKPSRGSIGIKVLSIWIIQDNKLIYIAKMTQKSNYQAQIVLLT